MIPKELLDQIGVKNETKKSFLDGMFACNACNACKALSR
jgi:hypothetical protein